jgi:ABC-type polysaccharide/polyol phosphate export permease
LKSIWDYRYFWCSLVRIDLRTRYRRSVLGIGWTFVNPLAMTAVLCVVFRQIFKYDNLAEAAPMFLTGYSFWVCFSAIIVQGCNSFLLSQRYILQEPAPLAIYPLRTVLSFGFHFLVSLMIAPALALALGGRWNPANIILLIPTIVLLFAFLWSVAMLAAFMHTYYPDTQHILEVGLQILFYLTPIIYPESILRDNGLGWVADWNPVAGFVGLLRCSLLGKTGPVGAYLLTCSILTAATCVAAAWVVRKQERELVFQL